MQISNLVSISDTSKRCCSSKRFSRNSITCSTSPYSPALFSEHRAWQMIVHRTVSPSKFFFFFQLNKTSMGRMIQIFCWWWWFFVCFRIDNKLVPELGGYYFTTSFSSLRYECRILEKHGERKSYDKSILFTTPPPTMMPFQPPTW